MDLKILEWNINQRRGRKDSNREDIPLWIPEEIINQKPDIAILTEVVTDRNWEKEIEPRLSQHYNVSVSDNTNSQHEQNDVAILIKKEGLEETSKDNSWESQPDKCIPDYLRVDCKIKGHELTIIGARLHILDSNMRKKEFEFILKQTIEIKNPILIAGDFNNYRRGAINLQPEWNIDVLVDIATDFGFTCHTPRGSSTKSECPYCNFGNKPICLTNQFAEDHFLTKNFYQNRIFKLCEYDRNFILKHGEEYGKETDFNGDLYPNPDHAMLKGILHLEEKHRNDNC